MHKDPSPGLFEFERRSLRYTIVCGLLTGFAASIPLYIAVASWRADWQPADPRPDRGARLEASVRASRSATPTPSNTAAVRY